MIAKVKKHLYLAFAVLAAIFITACPNANANVDNPDNSGDTPAVEVNFTVEASNAEITDAIPTVTSGTVTATVENASPESINFVSSNPSAIAIEGDADVAVSNGTAAASFTVLNAGEATITASFTSGETIYTKTVSVTAALADPTSVEGFAVNVDTDSITDHGAEISYGATDVTFVRYVVSASWDGGSLSGVVTDDATYTFGGTGAVLPHSTAVTAKVWAVGKDAKGEWYYTEGTKTFTTEEDTTAPGDVTINGCTPDERSVSFTWKNPSDSDLKSVIIHVYRTGEDEEDADEYEVPESEDSTFKAGRAYTYVVDDLDTNNSTGVSYEFKFYTKDTTGNVSKTPVTKTVSTKPDTTAPAEVTNVVLDMTTGTLTWTDSADTDAAKVYVYVGSTAAEAVILGTQTFQADALKTSSVVKITVEDDVENESTGVSIGEKTSPALSAVTTGYTGQLVATVSGTESGATYTVEAANEGDTVIYDNGKVYVNGLTVGTEFTPSVLFTAAYSDYTVKFNAVSGSAVAPTMTVWNLANSYTDNSYYLAFDLTDDRNYANGVIATAAEIAEQGCTYDRFVVLPGLEKGYGDYVTLELAKLGTSGIEESGYYVMSENSTANQGSWWRANTWVGGCNDYTLFAVEKADITSNAAATYAISSSAYSTSSTSDYILLNWLGDTTRYVRGFCFHATTIVPGSSTTADDSSEAVTCADYAWLKNESEWTIGKKVSDTEAPAEVTDLTAAAGRTNVKLTWTASTSDDVKEYKVYLGEATEASATVTETSANITGLTTETEYTFKVTAVDFNDNENTGSTVTATPTTPAPSNVTAAAQYTGSILVTWDDTDAEEEGITYTYKVTLTPGSGSALTKTVESGVRKAHFTDLTIGESYTATVTIVDSDSVTCGSASSEDGVKAVIVLWQIANAYTSNNSSVYSLYANESALDVASTDESSLASKKYNRWMVMPALDGSDNFSLQASNESYVFTNKYMYVDFSKTNTAIDISANGQGSRPHVYIGDISGDSGSYSIANGTGTAVTDMTMASFHWGSTASTAYTSSISSLTTKTFVGQWHVLGVDYTDSNCTDSSYYTFYDTWNRDSVQIGGESRGYAEYNFCYYEVTKDSDDLAGAPSDVTDAAYTESSLTATSVTLTWTNPSEADFDHVLITYDSESVTATGTSTTITGLSIGTSYTFTIKAVDMQGNESDGVTVSVTTAAGSNYPTSATATAGYTGQIIVSWTDATLYSDYTYTVVASADGESDVTKTVNQGVGKAVFNDLTIGTTYTFSLKATYSETDYEYTESTLSAQAVKVLWYVKGGYGDRIMMCNILDEDENGCTTDYSVIAEDPNQSSGTSGNVAVVNYDTLTYHYWLVLPSIDAPLDTDKFSLMATDATGTESGYYLYVDETRSVSSTANLKAWWTSLDTVNGWSNKLFVAKTSEDYITDNKMASFEQKTSAYDDGSWINLVCDYNGYYVQHSNLVYRMLESITEENCAALKATVTTLTE